jgi:hypothetical protein
VVYRPDSYFLKLGQLFDRLLDKFLYGSNATTLAELKDEIRDARMHLAALLISK